MSRSYTCSDCGFTSSDIDLVEGHSCDVALNRGFCEDYPSCGHEYGDCNGLLYGSDQSIKAQVERQWATGHGYCDHENGIYECDGNYDWNDDEDSDEDYSEDELQAEITDQLAYESGDCN